MENEIADLESSMDDCETFSSKVCLIMKNIRITNDIDGNVQPLKHQVWVCDLLKQCVNYETNPSNFETCHPRDPGKTNVCTSNSCRIYWGENNETYGRKPWPVRSPNPDNGRRLFFNEKLPPQQCQIKAKAEGSALITSTFNCHVRKNDDGR